MKLPIHIMIGWGALLVLLWAGTFLGVQWLIADGARSADDARFDRALRGLRGAEAERVERMRQGCRLMTTVPELRAVIGEHPSEMPDEKLAGLTERLNALGVIVDASCVCVLDTNAEAIAQNASSPWGSLGELRSFLTKSPEASALVKNVFAAATAPAPDQHPKEVWGLWSNGSELYHVVGMPLVFGTPDEAASRVDGALITATRVSDDMAAKLSSSQGCETTFIAGGHVAASSLPRDVRDGIVAAASGAPSTPFVMDVAGRTYRSVVHVLTDPCSGAAVGAVVVQSDQADVQRVQRRVAAVFVVVLAGGLVVVSIGGYVVRGRAARRESALKASSETPRRPVEVAGAGAITDAEEFRRIAQSLERVACDVDAERTEALLSDLQRQIDGCIASMRQRSTADGSASVPSPSAPTAGFTN